MLNDPALSQQRLLEQYFAQSVKHFPQLPVVLSEGDSWFSYPGYWNTIDHLDDMVQHKMSLLRLEQSGDTIQNMTSGTERAQMRHLFTIYPIDVLLFSGGGNDVVGPELLDLFDIVPPGQPWKNFIRQANLDSTFNRLQAAYESLALLRDTIRPNCWIFTHGYDYADPSGKPTKFWLWPIPINVVLGPWIQNNLNARGITAVADQRDVIKFLIDGFNETLKKVEAAHPRFVAIDNRGVIQANEWSDELHPTRDGFKKIADSFLRALREKLPGRF